MGLGTALPLFNRVQEEEHPGKIRPEAVGFEKRRLGETKTRMRC